MCTLERKGCIFPINYIIASSVCVSTWIDWWISLLRIAHRLSQRWFSVTYFNCQEKPNVVLDYNKNMGGIDLGDGVMVTNAAARNRVKKNSTVDWYVLPKCIYLVQKGKGHLDGLHFLLECIEKLINNNIKNIYPRPSTNSNTPKPSHIVERHFPELMKSDTGKSRSRKCQVCYKKSARKESTYWCPNCSVALCFYKCSIIFYVLIIVLKYITQKTNFEFLYVSIVKFYFVYLLLIGLWFLWYFKIIN